MDNQQPREPPKFMPMPVGMCLLAACQLCSCTQTYKSKKRQGISVGMWRNASISETRTVNVDTLGLEPRASRMLSGCDATTPRALDVSYGLTKDEMQTCIVEMKNRQEEQQNIMRMPEVDPGPQAWESCMMPLRYMCLASQACRCAYIDIDK